MKTKTTKAAAKTSNSDFTTTFVVKWNANKKTVPDAAAGMDLLASLVKDPANKRVRMVTFMVAARDRVRPTVAKKAEAEPKAEPKAKAEANSAEDAAKAGMPKLAARRLRKAEAEPTVTAATKAEPTVTAAAKANGPKRRGKLVNMELGRLL